jgi:TIR domain
MSPINRSVFRLLRHCYHTNSRHPRSGPRKTGGYGGHVVDSSVRVGDFVYDVALSFAGEQRGYVQKVAAALRRRGIRPFYDDYEKAILWGKDLYEHLDWIYQKAARYCVLFASEAYANKVWTTHERRSAQARALQSNQEYVLPVRFDDTEIPGMRPTIMYIDARSLSPGKLAELVSKKLGPRVRKNFFPPEPDKLFAALGTASPDERHAAERIAVSFMQTLMRMTVEERRLVVYIFTNGCQTQLPDNIHINLDFVRRDLNIARPGVAERIRHGNRTVGLRRAESRHWC